MAFWVSDRVKDNAWVGVDVRRESVGRLSKTEALHRVSHL